MVCAIGIYFCRTTFVSSTWSQVAVDSLFCFTWATDSKSHWQWRRKIVKKSEGWAWFPSAIQERDCHCWVKENSSQEDSLTTSQRYMKHLWYQERKLVSNFNFRSLTLFSYLVHAFFEKMLPCETLVSQDITSPPFHYDSFFESSLSSPLYFFFFAVTSLNVRHTHTRRLSTFFFPLSLQW